MYLTVLNQTFVLFIPIIIGYILKKRNLVDDNFSKSLSAVLFNVTLPCSIINAMQFEFDKAMLKESGLLVLICIFLVFLSYLASNIIVKLLKTKRKASNVISFALTFSNFSFMGYPIVETIYGSKGLFYAAVFTIPLFVLVNSLGIMILQKTDEGKSKIQLSSIINMPTIATLMGFVLFLFSLRLPAVADKAVTMFAQANTPMSMMLAGLVLAGSPILAIFKSIRHYIVTLLRLILFPALILIILKLCGISGLMLAIPVTIFSMPVASNVVLLSEKLGSDATYAAQTVLITSFFSIFTIPFIQMLL